MHTTGAIFAFRFELTQPTELHTLGRMATSERRWPRWWALDDWMALAVLAPAWSALRRIGRMRQRPLRIGLSYLIFVAIVLIGFWLG